MEVEGKREGDGKGIHDVLRMARSMSSLYESDPLRSLSMASSVASTTPPTPPLLALVLLSHGCWMSAPIRPRKYSGLKLPWSERGAAGSADSAQRAARQKRASST